jgi:hypothetical protein
MQFTRSKYKRLIIKHIQGETTPEEQKLAEAWISSSPANGRLYKTYQGLLLLTDKDKVSYNTDKAWENLQARIHSNQGSAAKPVKTAYRRLFYPSERSCGKTIYNNLKYFCPIKPPRWVICHPEQKLIY